MFSNRVAFVFVAALISVSFNEDLTALKRDGCGPYGFRCMNRNTLEFCPVSIDGSTDKLDIFSCVEGYYCDEDNPSYCTPRDAWVRVPEKGGVRRSLVLIQREVDEDVDYDEDGDYNEARYARSADVENRESSEATTDAVESVENTSVSQQFDDDKEIRTAGSVENPPFNCQSYGFFPDISSPTLFWYCDVPENGEGFKLRRMTCGQDRFFDELMQSCIPKETIQKDRQRSTANSTSQNNTNAAVNCLKKKPGKYPDEANCNIYHLCLPAQLSPVVQLTLKCPNDTAYDLGSRSCTTTALSRCQVKEDAPNKNKIDCRPPTRFRSVEDCGSYFVCFVDNVIEIKCPKFYKFDDTSLECLPEKVAECQEHAL